MQGKNRGKTLPPRKRRPKRTQDVSNPSQSTASFTPTTVSRQILPVTVPRKFGSDLSTIRFANAVEPRVVEVVLQCGLYHSSVSAMQMAYQLNTSLVHCQADSLPFRDMYLLREEGRGMDSASSIRFSLPSRDDLRFAVLLRRNGAPELLPRQSSVIGTLSGDG